MVSGLLLARESGRQHDRHELRTQSQREPAIRDQLVRALTAAGDGTMDTSDIGPGGSDYFGNCTPDGVVRTVTVEVTDSSGTTTTTFDDTGQVLNPGAFDLGEVPRRQRGDLNSTTPPTRPPSTRARSTPRLRTRLRPSAPPMRPRGSAFSQCMRTHGVPNFPEPTNGPGAGRPSIWVSSTSTPTARPSRPPSASASASFPEASDRGRLELAG